MSAAFYNNAQMTMMTDNATSGRDHFSMPTAFMCLAAATSAILLTTGVLTSVSLFVRVVVILPLLLLGLVVLISLVLSRLTGLVTLESLVGLETERTARREQGD